MDIIFLADLGDSFEPSVYGNVDPYSDAGINLFSAWLKANGFNYYARPKERFSLSEAIRITKAKGLAKVIVENLS